MSPLRVGLNQLIHWFAPRTALREDVPRAVDFRRRSLCDGQVVRTIAASLLTVWAAIG